MAFSEKTLSRANNLLLVPVQIHYNKIRQLGVVIVEEFKTADIWDGGKNASCS